ncbi:MAG: FHA domain-containing protein [Phycisphaerales bacterium]|nr:FHA domain-containing protein [Phycisphaerales bacterium]
MLELHVCTRTGRMLKAFALGDRSEVILGRDDTCDIQIRSPQVSSEHCAIEPQGDELFLRDLGSSGGVLVRGRKVERIRVEDGLEAVVGPAVLRFIESA